MKHKVLTILMVSLLLISSISFAGTTLSSQDIEIVSPIINENGEVVYSANINITLKLNTDVEALMTIMRVTFSAEEEVERIKQIAFSAPTSKFLLQSADKSKQDPIVKVSFSDIYNKSMSLEEIQTASIEQAKKLKDAYDTYVHAYEKALKKYNKIPLQSFIEKRLLLVNDLGELHKARQAYERHAILYIHIQSKYEESLRHEVVSNVPVKKEGALPFFNYTLKDVKTGKYEIIIIDKKTGRTVIPVKRFSVKSHKETAEDLLKAFKDEMINLWKTD